MRALAILLFLAGCECAGEPIVDAGDDAAMADAGKSDAGSSIDAGPIDAGCTGDERAHAGDYCNFCECTAGANVCTDRTCPDFPGCDYDGVAHAYGERFPSTDGCNECVCAASGLACTRRDCPGALEEGAILAESLDEGCGDPSFTARSVIEGLPFDDFVLPFLYERDGPIYPEIADDTEIRVRIVYDGGFLACRIPMPGQEAWDIEVALEFVTADGAFDEGFHGYLRRNASGFVISWFVAVSAPAAGLNGTYDPRCLDPNGFGFTVQIFDDQTVQGSIDKACETDISLTVGTFTR